VSRALDCQGSPELPAELRTVTDWHRRLRSLVQGAAGADAYGFEVIGETDSEEVNDDASAE